VASSQDVEINVFEGCELIMSPACVSPGEAPWLVFTAEVETAPCPDVFCTAAAAVVVRVTAFTDGAVIFLEPRLDFFF
jgi:hypothetical protein